MLKKAEQEQRTIVFVDEAGFYLLPMVVHMYALQRRKLKNLCYQDLTHLSRELVRAKERPRHRREILRHCFARALDEV